MSTEVELDDLMRTFQTHMDLARIAQQAASRSNAGFIHQLHERGWKESLWREARQLYEPAPGTRVLVLRYPDKLDMNVPEEIGWRVPGCYEACLTKCRCCEGVNGAERVAIGRVHEQGWRERQGLALLPEAEGGGRA